MTCPNGNGTGEFVIALDKILKVEARLDEAGYMTRDKAAEYMATVTDAWSDIQKIVVRLRSEHNKAKRATKEREAVVMLDECEGILKEKGLPSTSDYRKAVVQQDKQYQVCQDREAALYAAMELMKGKMEHFYESYTSVKKLLGDNQLPSSGIRDRGNQPTSGFGRPSY